MSGKRVEVKGCPKLSMNLYKVSDDRGKYYVYQVEAGFFSNTLRDVGTAGSLRDALELVKAHSGGDNLAISDW